MLDVVVLEVVVLEVVVLEVVVVVLVADVVVVVGLCHGCVGRQAWRMWRGLASAIPAAAAMADTVSAAHAPNAMRLRREDVVFM
ncbi:hypothetical protein [Pedococcus sp. 5OH_020]|uniref:hypothetical protein n=1 Tax=Pedococcus sp. 5OH_020 TaxID=2989814 RepID=UPI0022E9A0B5|nr:hypothetical protein [Pedococcus sp. 5OH_020]